MPFYDFLNEKTGEIKPIFFHMNDEKVYIDESGYKWIRQFESVNTAIDTQIDPNSGRDFINKTAKKNYSLGDLWDQSAILSEKRAKVSGKDPIKEKTINDYTKKTKGKQHPGTRKKSGIFDLMKDITKKK